MPEIKQHTIRLPVRLYDLISMRAVSTGRSTNREIELLLKKALDSQAEADQEAVTRAVAAN